MKFYKCLAIVFGIFVAFLLGEIATRIYYYRQMSDNTLVLTDDLRIYTHKPSIKFINKYGVEVEYNSLGFIGKEVGAKKNEGVFRILGIGDSVTAATQVSLDRGYLNRVAHILSERTEKDVEIINAAVGGYNTWQELELLKTVGLLVEPDIVIVGICMNDFVQTEPVLREGWFGKICASHRDGSKARYFDFLYQRSDLYKILYDFLSSMRRGLYNEEGYRRYVEKYYFEIKPEDFQRWKKPFSDMMILTKKHNIKILFVLFPLKNQVAKGEDKSYGPLSDFFSENGVYHLDLISYFKRQAISGKPLFRERDLIHPTPLGYEIAAKAIADYIKENNLLR